MSSDSTDAGSSESDDATISAKLNLDDDDTSEFALVGQNLSSREVKLILAAVVVIIVALLWWGPL